MRALLIAIIIALQLLLGWCYWQDSDSCCGNTTTNVEEAVKKVTPVVAKKVTGPLLFNWSNGATVTNDAWPNKKKSILDALRDNQILEITGLYRSDETNNSTFENLGIARANQTRKLFTELPDDRVSLLGKLIDGKVDKNGLFESARFANRIVTKTIKETADGTLIYFPYSSTQKLNNRDVESYLNDVADRVRASGERVQLTGHTDSKSSSASNMRLGKRRADVIKSYLVSKGVSSSKIVTQSKGEESPIASNNTDAGRAKNRRTELKIIK